MSFISPNELAKYGISNVKEVIHNPSYQELFNYETDKASFDEEVKVSGTLLEIFFNYFLGRACHYSFFAI